MALGPSIRDLWPATEEVGPRPRESRRVLLGGLAANRLTSVGRVAARRRADKPHLERLTDRDRRSSCTVAPA